MSESSAQFRDRMRREIKPVVVRGVLGWGNRKGGYEAYGLGGRWEGEGAYADSGDLLGDALERAGAHEGATLLVIAVDRFGDTSLLDEIERQLDGETPAEPATHDTSRCGPTQWGFDCVLPAGHNQGQFDLPERHTGCMDCAAAVDGEAPAT